MAKKGMARVGEPIRLPDAEPGAAASPSQPYLKRLTALMAFFVLLAMAFGGVFLELTQYAMRSDLHSHVLLIPFVTAWLIRGRVKDGHVPTRWSSAPGYAMCCFVLAIAALSLKVVFAHRGLELHKDDQFSLLIAAVYCLALAGCALACGRETMRTLSFPIAFALLAIPLPIAATEGLERMSQLASAEASSWLFSISGTPVFREGVIFALPGTVIEVARECSGIRSSIVLVITSLIAADLYLRTGWKKALLVLATFPIGILRNSIRIFTLAMLSVHVDPAIMKSALHSRGGPLFFALSLLPLFGLLIWLIKSEATKNSEGK